MTRDTSKKQSNIPELLSPAGSPSALRAAIDGGADAVYFAMPEFNARINADNFTPDSFAEGVELCHISGVRAYITLNTQVYDRERADFLRTAEKAYLAGVDAAIVGDLGAARLLKEYIPELELHASTQLSGHSAECGRVLSELGFTRMVCAREMSLDDIRTFTETAPLEAEIFIHGALCVCHSGQCLFSSLVGGRSGNRGLCAQPCRLPYKVPKGKNEYPLSLKDMSLAAHIPEIIDSGVASLKIEGRMKPADYVYRVTSIYRALLDERRSATREEQRLLAAAFSRGGSFTDSYFTGRARGSLAEGMLGVRSESDKDRSKELSADIRPPRKTEISLSARIVSGEPMSLILTLNGGDVARFKGIEGPSVTVFGDTPDAALNRPIDKAMAVESLSKFGGTPFSCKDTDIQLDGGLIVPRSSLNALRRSGVEALTELIHAPYRARSGFSMKDPSSLTNAPTTQKNGVTAERIAVFYDPTRITREATEFFNRIFVPLSSLEGTGSESVKWGDVSGVLMPPVIFDSEHERAARLLRLAYSKGMRLAIAENFGQLPLVRQSGLTPLGGLRLGVANTDSALAVRSLGINELTLSPELTLPRMRDIARTVEGCAAVVYGKLPMMITEKCVIREVSSCDECKRRGGSGILTDRTGARFYLKREFGHRTLIFNSLPTYTADMSDKLAPLGLSSHIFLFTDEDRSAVNGVIEAYRNHIAPTGKVRRI